ncbi:MAG TPA: redoxin domain-containing protein [Acidimicrobiales bacterium]|nr:redoxin domain-containing protein [Acidimicrobiales bacterium]
MTRPDRTTPHSPGGAARRRLFFAGLGIVLSAALAAVLLSVHHAPGPGVASSKPVTLPGVSAATADLIALSTFPQGGPAAPDFHLTDQNGHPVSLSRFRAKSVVLSFNDDRCTDVCTLLAEDVVRADQYLGAAGRRHVVFLSVNVNPFFPDPQAVRQWTDENSLGAVGNWYFATGPVATLEAVWKAYGIYVGTDAKTRTVSHGAVMEYIGTDGRIRASGDFGQNAVDVDPFAHGMAQTAVDLLPRVERTPVAGPQASPGGGTGAGLGQHAPAFDLPVLSAPTSKLPSAGDLGHPVVLNFWASSCANCRSELADFARVAAQDPGIRFVGVDVADPSPPAAAALTRSAGVGYPTVVDSGGRLASEYGVAGLPTTVYIDPTGRIAVVHPGAMTAEQLHYTLAQFFPSDTPAAGA